jgi:Flp pilus assembly protein TadD
MGLLLAGVTFLAYLPVFQGQFIWDDDSWTTNIGRLLRNVSGLRLIWFQFTALQQYYPLTATTFWLDYHLWGFWPLPYHVENVLLHALAALLFWRLLERLGVVGAWLAAAIFALHPVMVESAGWITERKNVLSLVFYLGALLAYGRYNGFWQAERTSRWRWGHYTIALFLFLGALLAKTTAFSLPAVVLLIGWWKGGRWRWRAEVLPTVPFFVLSFGMCLATAWLEKNHVMAQGPDFALTFPERCLIAGRAPWFYLGQLLWPVSLCFIYPQWPLNAGSWQQWLYPVTAVGVLLALWLARKRIGRGPAAAAFFFVGTLFPVLGFMNAYGMRFSYVWDHWVYLSSLGPIALGSALVARAAKHLRASVVLYGFAAIVLPVQAILTWRQCGMYVDAETLWRTTIARNPEAWMAYHNLGTVLFKKGRMDEAIAQFQKVLASQPDDTLARDDFGIVLRQIGQEREAIAQFQKVLASQPDDAVARDNLGQILLQKGQAREAAVQFQKALESDPTDPIAHDNLGIILLQQGQVDKAIQEFQKALATQPDNALARNNLGLVLCQKGRVDEAIVEFQKALAVLPDDTPICNNLGKALLANGQQRAAMIQFQKVLENNPLDAKANYYLGIVLFQTGWVDKAMAHFQKALESQPDFTDAWDSLDHTAWLLATSPEASVRNGPKALALARQLARLSGGNNLAKLDTLAAAYAETGQFPEAIDAAQQALALALSQNNTALASTLRQHIKLFQAGVPLRDVSQTNADPDSTLP